MKAKLIKARNTTSSLSNLEKMRLKPETTEQPLDFVAFLAHGPVVLPRREAIRFWWNNRNVAKIECKLTRLIALVDTIHQQIGGVLGRRPQSFEQLPSGWGVVHVAGRQGKGYGCVGICGNQMNFGGPATA